MQVVHGISIPLGKLGIYLPRTISAAISSDRASPAQTSERDPDEPAPFHVRQHLASEEQTLSARFRNRLRGHSSTGRGSKSNTSLIPGSLARVGASIATDLHRAPGEPASSGQPSESSDEGRSQSIASGLHISGPQDPRKIGKAMNIEPGLPGASGFASNNASGAQTPVERDSRKNNDVEQPMTMAPVLNRTIRFGDAETPSASQAKKTAGGLDGRPQG